VEGQKCHRPAYGGDRYAQGGGVAGRFGERVNSTLCWPSRPALWTGG